MTAKCETCCFFKPGEARDDGTMGNCCWPPPPLIAEMLVILAAQKDADKQWFDLCSDNYCPETPADGFCASWMPRGAPKFATAQVA